MLITEIGEEECRSILVNASHGHLGCCFSEQPYVVPISFAFEPDYFYIISTSGQKVDWMRKNPKVCVQVDEIKNEVSWVSVIANGTYQELLEPQYTEERKHARKLLDRRVRWWQTPLAERQAKSDNELIETLFFRVRVESFTGLRALDHNKD